MLLLAVACHMYAPIAVFLAPVAPINVVRVIPTTACMPNIFYC